MILPGLVVDPYFDETLGPEVVVLRCDVVARPGVRFAITVTDRRVLYVRRVWFRLSAVETVACDLRAVSNVELRARSPWPARVFGALLLAGAPSAFALAREPSEFVLPGHGPNVGLVLIGGLLAIGAIVCFLRTGRARALVWREGGRQHRVAQPETYDAYTRDSMSEALGMAARLLADPAALRAEVARARARAGYLDAPATSGTDLDARRPCPDDACTGVLGEEGRCGVCGSAGTEDACRLA